jgi:hypothetical protein
VQRVWSDLGLQPHRVDTFKVSTDSRFVEKLVDVVGLYLAPPDQAAVFCLDQKSQIQALDRTQPSLPMTPGPDDDARLQAQRHYHALFAVLNALTGKVIGQCLPRHTHAEFVTFLKRVDREVPKRLQLHVILDNYATHSHPEVERWLDKHP